MYITYSKILIILKLKTNECDYKYNTKRRRFGERERSNKKNEEVDKDANHE